MFHFTRSPSKHLWLYSYHSLNVRKTATAKCCWFRNQPIVCDTIVVQVEEQASICWSRSQLIAKLLNPVTLIRCYWIFLFNNNNN